MLASTSAACNCTFRQTFRWLRRHTIHRHVFLMFFDEFFLGLLCMKRAFRCMTGNRLAGYRSSLHLIFFSIFCAVFCVFCFFVNFLRKSLTTTSPQSSLLNCVNFFNRLPTSTMIASKAFARLTIPHACELSLLILGFASYSRKKKKKKKFFMNTWRGLEVKSSPPTQGVSS